MFIELHKAAKQYAGTHKLITVNTEYIASVEKMWNAEGSLVVFSDDHETGMRSVHCEESYDEVRVMLAMSNTGVVLADGSAAPPAADKGAFNVRLFAQVLSEIIAEPKIWDQNIGSPDRLPCCFVCLVARKLKKELRSEYPEHAAAALLNLDTGSVEYLYHEHRTLADFAAFLAADGTPPTDWWST